MKQGNLLFCGLLLAVQVLLAGPELFGQSSFSMEAELVSRYIWRGIDVGNRAPAIHPSLEYSYTTKNGKHCLSVGAWGAYTISEATYEEVDLLMDYCFNGMLDISLSDYFYPGQYTGRRNHYFNYDADSTGHVIEAAIGFTGNNKVPVTALFTMNVYGNDSRKARSDSTAGSIVMSKYLEVGFIYSFTQFDLNVFIGAALDNPDKRIATEGYYSNPHAGIINVGIKASRSFKLADHLELPVQTQIVVNTMLQKVWLVFGVALAFES